MCLLKNGRYDEAEEILTKALATEKANWARRTSRLRSHCKKAMCVKKITAVDVLNQAVASQTIEQGEDTLYNRGVGIRDSDRPKEAEPLLWKNRKTTERRRMPLQILI